MDYYQRAADENYAGGWNGLARMYDEGLGVEQDAVKAFECYSMQAACGVLYNLGVRY